LRLRGVRKNTQRSDIADDGEISCRTIKGCANLSDQPNTTDEAAT
jgi:hypothetical protein